MAPPLQRLHHHIIQHLCNSAPDALPAADGHASQALFLGRAVEGELEVAHCQHQAQAGRGLAAEVLRHAGDHRPQQWLAFPDVPFRSHFAVVQGLSLEQEQVVAVVALLVLLLVALKEEVRVIGLDDLLVDLEDCGLEERQLLELLEMAEVGVVLEVVAVAKSLDQEPAP